MKDCLTACHKRCVRFNEPCDAQIESQDKLDDESDADARVKSSEDILVRDDHFGGNERQESKKRSLSNDNSSENIRHHARSFIGELISPEKREYLNDSLNIFSKTPKNFIKFVNTIGPFLDLKDSIYDILIWRNAKQTWFCYFSALLVLSFPKLLFLLPHFIILYLILASYKAKMQYLYSCNSKKVDLAMKDLKNWERSRQINYKKNLTGIQNMMGEYADAHNQIMAFGDLIMWKNEKFTALVLKVLLITIFPLLFAIFTLSFQAMMFSIITALFFSHHPVTLRYMPYWKKRMMTMLSWIDSLRLPKLIVSIVEAKFDCSNAEGRSNTIQIYENERWWVGAGWSPPMLTELSHFSDMTGQLAAPKESFKLQSSMFQWVDEWKVDKSFREVDSDGWEYGDANWQNWKRKPSWNSFTRRRKWIRQMQLQKSKLD